MKKILSVILCLTFVAALEGCKDGAADASNQISNTVFDPSNYDPTLLSESFNPVSSDFSLPTTGDPFTNEELMELSIKHYQSIWGIRPKAEVVYENDTVVYVYLYDSYTVDEYDAVYVDQCDVYIINRASGTGQNSSGEEIDLTAYI